MLLELTNDLYACMDVVELKLEMQNRQMADREIQEALNKY